MELPDKVEFQLSRSKHRSLELTIQLPGLWVGVHVADEPKRVPVFWLSFAKNSEDLAEAPKVLLGAAIGSGLFPLKDQTKKSKSGEHVRLIAMRHAIARVNGQWFTRAERIMRYMFWRVVEYDDCLMSWHEHHDLLGLIERDLGMY